MRKKPKINLQKFDWILKIVLDFYKFALNGVNKFFVNNFPKSVNKILKIFALIFLNPEKNFAKNLRI